MSDSDQVSTLLAIASNPAQLQAAQHVATQRLLAYDGEVFPSDGCAITLSVLLQDAGIAVADTFLAFDLARVLSERGWTDVLVGSQKAGDVGSTCGAAPVHGQDHIYMVLRPVNADEMVIADNQASLPHFRFASGAGGKTPTRKFLRAPADDGAPAEEGGGEG